jgi:inner membrane protein
MPSAFAHALASLTITKAGPKRIWSRKLAIVSIISGVLPDLDCIGFHTKVPYDHPLGHRGFSHSILFALLWALVLTILAFKKSTAKFKIFVVLFLSTISHGILDAFTNGGQGVGFFIPFNNERFFFPMRPIEASPLSIASFFEQALPILTNEILWIGIPCLLVFLATSAGKKLLRR